MLDIKRIVLIIGFICLAFRIAGSSTAGATLAILTREIIAEQSLPASEWARIKAAAAQVVDHESPDSVFPFDLSFSKSSGREVLVHYFINFPPSVDNKPPNNDYWSTQALSPSGLNGKYFAAGGFVRERPLPLSPWVSTSWREYDFALDVLRAQRMGADGFIVALFQLPPAALWSSARLLCDTAAQVAPGFKVVPQLDADALTEASPEDMARTVYGLVGCKSLKYLADGRLSVIVFDPAHKPASFWQQVVSAAAAQGLRLALTPIFLNPVGSASQYAGVSDGLSYWGAADPGGVSGPSSGEPALRSVISQWSFNWMAPVRPQDFRPKSAMVSEAGNTSLYRALWDYAIRAAAPAVHVVTWNDYTESSETEPSSRSQFLWYDLTRYYIEWYKNRGAPIIRQDAIYFSHRGQIFKPDNPPEGGQSRFRVMGLTPVKNNVEMVAMLTSASTLEIETGGQTCRRDAAAGLAVLSCPAGIGQPKFRINRNGRALVEVSSPWTIEQYPTREDGLYYGGSSTRSSVP